MECGEREREGRTGELGRAWGEWEGGDGVGQTWEQGRRYLD